MTVCEHSNRRQLSGTVIRSRRLTRRTPPRSRWIVLHISVQPFKRKCKCGVNTESLPSRVLRFGSRIWTDGQLECSTPLDVSPGKDDGETSPLRLRVAFDVLALPQPETRNAYRTQGVDVLDSAGRLIIGVVRRGSWRYTRETTQNGS